MAAGRGKVTKVILENYYLTDEQKREGVRIVKRAGADFVKTSTGFAARRRDAGRCQALVQEAGVPLRSKHSAGIRTREFAEQLLDIGATRLGASNPHLLMV